MYGDLAGKLIQDSRRTVNLDHLPAYQDELVAGVLRETLDLNNDYQELAHEYREMMNIQSQLPLSEQSPEDQQEYRQTACALMVMHLSMARNKRCLMAYEKLRADHLDRMAWDEVDYLDPENTYNLSAAEQEYLKHYSDLVVDYKGVWTDIDLTGSLEPPKDLFIDVRVLRDAGEIQTEYGVFNLTKGSQYYVRQADVQRLIQQGYLVKL
jgi:GINS complex subunit 1